MVTEHGAAADRPGIHLEPSGHRLQERLGAEGGASPPPPPCAECSEPALYLRMLEHIFSYGIQVRGVLDVADVVGHSLDHHIAWRQDQLVGPDLRNKGTGQYGSPQCRTWELQALSQSLCEQHPAALSYSIQPGLFHLSRSRSTWQACVTSDTSATCSPSILSPKPRAPQQRTCHEKPQAADTSILPTPVNRWPCQVHAAQARKHPREPGRLRTEQRWAPDP